MKKLYLLIALFSILNLSCKNSIDDPLDQLNSVTKLDIYITENDYNTLLENRFSDIKVPADIYSRDSHIKASIEPQGTGSRFFTKWGFKIHCKTDMINGLNTFNLSVQTYDKTKIKTALASYLYSSMGFPLFYSSHSFVKINEHEKGLYLLTETIDEDFFNKRNIPVYELIKVEYGAKFTYTEKNVLEDNFEKKIPDDKNLTNLSEFIYAVDTTDAGRILSELNKFIDVKEYLTYHAVTSIINNSDGFTNNFYLYKETPLSPYKLVPWDFDKTFDPNAKVGLWGESSLISKLFKNDSCFKIYKSVVKEVVEKYFTEGKLYPIIDSYYNKIKDAYYLDPFLNSISLEDEVNKLKIFIRERREYILSNLQ